MIAEPILINPSLEKTGYTIERLTASNISDVATLYAEIHTKPLPLSYFQKKYNAAYTGAAYIGFVAYNKHHLPIAFYGVIPCFIKQHDRLVLAAQSADIMTHPKYRYKGLFVQLVNATIDLCTQAKIRLMFGLPNQVALHGFLIKLQWQLTETMNHFIIPVKYIRFEKFIPKIPFTKRVYSIYKSNVLKKYLLPVQGIDNALLQEDYAGVYRDDSYFSHKTYNPTYVLKINNALVWVKINKKMVIGDIKCTAVDFDEVIDTLRKISGKLGVSSIDFHTSHGTEMCDLFAKKYRSTPSFHVVFKDLGADIALDKIKFTHADSENF